MYVFDGLYVYTLFFAAFLSQWNPSNFLWLINGFRKVDPDRWEFANEGFLKGQKQLLKSIIRRKPTQVQPPQQPQRDKNVLMQELVRLRQQQQVTEHHLQHVGQKVHVMEQRQQQMMSFLAKAVQSPGFLNQFSQQSNNEGNQHISESNKKRRLPVEDQKNRGGSSQGLNGLSRQIVRYQSSMNESSNSMLQQIHNMSNTHTNNHGSFLLGDVPNPNLSDNGSSSNGPSGVVAFTDVSSNTTNQVLETNLPYPQPQADLLAPKQGAEGGSGSPSPDLVGGERDNGECLDPIMAVLDGSMMLETNELLPGVQDSLWEQFFGESSGIGDSDELVSGSVDNELIMEQLELQPNLRNVCRRWVEIAATKG
ncbi:hypothetical protein HID58_044725 [Brassica napus]|uniref:HSF-type DNA-binding domain-containing protein n=1 Tax=Brassica napus TaxID=3708 RepID=A0ABQ8BK87_BRANA|nr:hypothetical protein HID58_044725 [Brassica napus]